MNSRVPVLGKNVYELVCGTRATDTENTSDRVKCGSCEKVV